MKTIIAILALTISMSAQAASFKSVKTMSGTAMENLSKTMSEVFKDATELYGDAINVEALSYKSKSSESTLNTVKQLLMKRELVNFDDVDAVAAAVISEQLAYDTILAFDINVLDEDAQKIVEADTKKILAALKVVSKYGIQVYQSSHSDEDGTWVTLTLVDLEHNEILVITSGFHGT